MFLEKAIHTKIQLHLDLQKMAIVIPVLVSNPENNKQILISKNSDNIAPPAPPPQKKPSQIWDNNLSL